MSCHTISDVFKHCERIITNIYPLTNFYNLLVSLGFLTIYYYGVAIPVLAIVNGNFAVTIITILA